MTLYSRDTTTTYGFTSLPADQTKTPAATKTPSALSISDLPIPESPLAQRINAYAKHELPPDTYRHSLRVFSYGCAIARQCFPDFHVDPSSTLEETWFLTAMLHDIGTTPKFLPSSRLSYEFFAGIHALTILQSYTHTAMTPGCSKFSNSSSDAPLEQAESVCEAIIRHQDVQPLGNITLMTRLIHMGTLLDNIGAGIELVNEKTIEAVNAEYGRKGWSGCFKGTVDWEKREKPYAMVSRIEGFEEKIEGNGKGEGVMARWD